MYDFNEVKLITGEFKPGEAEEILFSIIEDKIRFNSRQIFSYEERGIDGAERYNKRIEELQQSKDKIAAIINRSKAENKILSIESSIVIKEKPEITDN